MTDRKRKLFNWLFFWMWLMLCFILAFTPEALGALAIGGYFAYQFLFGF
jgi:hypothetical protein